MTVTVGTQCIFLSDTIAMILGFNNVVPLCIPRPEVPTTLQTYFSWCDNIEHLFSPLESVAVALCV